MASRGLALGGRAIVNLFDGSRQPFRNPKDILITVIDGNQQSHSRTFHDSASVLFGELPVFNNSGDNYTFLASAPGCKDAGLMPVHIAQGVVQQVDLMLIPKSNALHFANAKWTDLASRPKLAALLAQGAESTDAAANRYSDVMERSGGELLACLLNITTAADQISLPRGAVLDYWKGVIWDFAGDSAMAQDRFYGWANSEILHQLAVATTQGKFAVAPHALHKGATVSYKQVEFGEANLQLTFHEQDRQTINGVECVKVEPDIDYFRDAGAHLLLEVAVNAFGSLTDPRAVYVLRWIAGQRAGIPEFDPLYTIEAA